ncbi:MAG: multicopper oxidase domain-containing protein [Symploca sp. SIO3C6]|nr:multicopper oxidase domain-containing protein [Symploca sp. SIO3C6]
MWVVVGGKESATDQNNSTYYLVSDLTTGLTEGEKWFEGRSNRSYLLATVEVAGDQVCYQDSQNNSLSLQYPSSSPTVDCPGENLLYDYIKEQEAQSQTRVPDSTNNVDKILPKPEALFDGFYKDATPQYTIPQCKDRRENFADLYKDSNGQEGCLTPSTLYSDPLTKKRYFYFEQDRQKFFLTGSENKEEEIEYKELYDATRIDKISRIGDLEEWHLVNKTGSPHVFHIHQLDFVVTEVELDKDPCIKKEQGKTVCTYNNYEVETDPCPQSGNEGYLYKLKPQGYRDVINLPPHSTTTIRIPFVNPFISGIFVYHCHILFHEDRGMMNNLQVINTKGYGDFEVIPQLSN